MRRLNHLDLFEEIGFDYSNREKNEPENKGKISDIEPFPLSSIERSYKKVAKSAFDAGKSNVMTFDEWWSNTWNFNDKEKEVRVKKKYKIMEELKNIRNYQEFKDSLNEELLWGAIKKLFSTIFAKIDKKLADNITNFTKKLDGSRNWTDSLRLFEQSTKDRQTICTENMNAATGPLGIRKVLYETSLVLFAQLQEMSNKYQLQDIAAKKVFEGQQEANMFNFDKVDDFNKNALAACNAKMLEMNKANTAGYDEASLKKYLESHPDMSAVQSTNPAPTNTTVPPDQKAKNDKMRGNTTENKNFDDQHKLFEADNAPAPDPNATPKGDINKLKESSNKWISNNLLGFSLQKVKGIKPPAAANAANDPFSIAVKNTKSTNYPDNLAKLLRNIVNLPPGILPKVRDAIAGAEGKDKEQFKQEMGLL